MKVLLVKPNNLSDHIQPSLGLGYMAEQIRKDHDVEFFDCIKERVNPADFTQVLERSKPDVVGIQCYTFDLRNVRALLNVVKTYDPKLTTVVGGAHISSDPEGAFLNFGKQIVDYGWVGEAETSFPGFLQKLEKGDKDFSKIPGVAWWEGDKVKHNPLMYVDDLDALGAPAWDLLKPETYPESQHGAFFKKFPIAPIITTRGCPFSCTFCSAPMMSGKKLRHHSLEYVLAQINHLYHDRGVREIHIVDDNFTMEIDYAKMILRGIIDLKLDISLALPNGIRMDYLDDELLEIMREAGVYVVSVAVESGTDRILKLMKKGMTRAKIEKCIGLIRKHDLDVAAFFILGFPSETKEEIQETIKLSRNLDLVRANYFTYLPLPGTESYRKLLQSGEIQNVDWDHFYFTSAAYVPKGMTREELLKMKSRAFFRFYFTPSVFLKNLRAIQNFNHFRFLLKRFFNWFLTPNYDKMRRKEEESLRVPQVPGNVVPAKVTHSLPAATGHSHHDHDHGHEHDHEVEVQSAQG